MKYMYITFLSLLLMSSLPVSLDLNNTISIFYANYNFINLAHGDNRVLDFIIKNNFSNGYKVEIKSENNGSLKLNNSESAIEIPYDINITKINGRVPDNLETTIPNGLSNQYIQVVSTNSPNTSTDVSYKLSVNFNSMFNNLMSGEYTDKIILKYTSY